MVGGGECERKTFRRVEGGGSDSGTIEVVGGGECEKLNFRRVRGGGGASCSNSCHDDVSVDNTSNSVASNPNETSVAKSSLGDISLDRVMNEDASSPSIIKHPTVSNNVDENVNDHCSTTTRCRGSQPVCLVTTRWSHDPLFPRAVHLFQHLSSFTRNVDIARNGMVEGRFLAND